MSEENAPKSKAKRSKLLNKDEMDTKSKIVNKRGRTPWKQADLLTVRNKSPNFRYRWVNTDDRNISKKEREGWVYARNTEGVPGEHEPPGHMQDGSPLTSDGTSYKDQVVMALPEEIALDRDEEMKDRVRAQSHEKMQEELKRDVANLECPKAPLHGGISFD